MVETHPETTSAAEPMALTPPLCPGPMSCAHHQPSWKRIVFSLHLATLVGQAGPDLAWELSAHASEMVEKHKLFREKCSVGALPFME